VCYGYGRRRFPTSEERTKWLEDYKSDLETEIKAVSERIQELKDRQPLRSV